MDTIEYATFRYDTVEVENDLNDMDTIEYATFRYDTVEVESGLYRGRRYWRGRDYSIRDH